MWLRLILNTWSSCFHLRLEARATMPGLAHCQDSAYSRKFCCHLSQKSHWVLRKPLFTHLLQILKQQRSSLGGGLLQLSPSSKYCFPQGIGNGVSLGGWSRASSLCIGDNSQCGGTYLWHTAPLSPPLTETPEEFPFILKAQVGSRTAEGVWLAQGPGFQSPHWKKQSFLASSLVNSLLP